MTEPEQQKQPEKRCIQLDLKECQTSCSFLVYRSTLGVLVIVTPEEAAPTGYFQSPELAAIAACELFKIDPRLLVWIEHRLEDGHDQYARVVFDRTTIIGSDYQAVTAFHHPQRSSIEKEEVREIQRRLGYTPESETQTP